jgi:hypothetical protein
MTGTRASPSERLARHSCANAAGCVIWNGSLNNKGYGQIGHNRRVVLAHRLSYELRHGEIPKGLQVLHRCDVPACINPDHLFLGDTIANMADMHAKGRAAIGERVASSKLTSADVIAIRKSTKLHRELAVEFGVSQSAITMIRQGKRWKHISVSEAA